MRDDNTVIEEFDNGFYESPGLDRIESLRSGWGGLLTFVTRLYRGASRTRAWSDLFRGADENTG